MSYLIQKMLVLSISEWSQFWRIHKPLPNTKDLSEPLQEAAPPERATAARQRYNSKDKNALAEIVLGVKIQHLPTLAVAHTERQAL